LRPPINDQQDLSFSGLVRDCNAVVSDIGTKSFQNEIATTGTFRVVSPVSGRSVSVHANYVLPRGGVIYLFRDDTDFCLLSSCLSKGHPITAAVIGNRVLPFVSPHFRDAKLEEIALEILSNPPADMRPVTNTDRSRMIVGDANFAHFLWNEFPTLDEVARSGAAVDVTIMFDPFGITGQEDTPATWETQDQIGFLRGWHSQVTFMGTSHFCPAPTRDRLLDLVGCSSFPGPTNAPPRIYLSVRPSGRTLEDQGTFLVALISEFRRRNPGVTFVLDGFSFPQDFHRCIYNNLRQPFETRASDAKDIVQGIVSALPPPHDDITDITGLPIVEALKTIAGCRYYITHSGTHQHKIAWLFNRPGFMHGNKQETSPQAVRWLKLQVGDTQSPTVIKAEGIEDLDVSCMPKEIPRNRQYRFLDKQDVIQTILEDFAQKWGDPAP